MKKSENELNQLRDASYNADEASEHEAYLLAASKDTLSYAIDIADITYADAKAEFLAAKEVYIAARDAAKDRLKIAHGVYISAINAAHKHYNSENKK
jgi:CRISPR/Cas system-associated protein Cas5 (RAMP superfamily)